MNDCRNAEIRDQLPDLLHDRLSAGERAVVFAHVDACGDCRDELELLRGLNRALVAGTPRIDTACIVSALPKPGASVAVPVRPSRPTRSRWRVRWEQWEVAATITVLVVGVGSAAVLSRTVIPHPVVSVAPAPSGEGTSARVAVPGSDATPVATASSTGEPAARTKVPSAAAQTVAEEDVPGGDGPEMEGRLTGLNEQQLRALLNDIGQLKAVPVTEPEPVTINVKERASSGDAGAAEWM